MNSEKQKEKSKNNQIQEEQKDNTEKEKDLTNIPTFDEFINLSYEEFGVNCIKSISKIFSNNLYICSLKIYSKDKFNLEIRVQKKNWGF